MVEVARIHFRTTVGWSLSLLAQNKDGRIQYRLINEYPEVTGDFEVLTRVFGTPLSFGELVELLDGLRFKDAADGY